MEESADETLEEELFSSAGQRDVCLCHCRKAPPDARLTKFTVVSWEKLRSAAELRKDETWKKLEGSWESGPRGAYHRDCYQAYTHREHLERLQRRRSEGKSTCAPEAAEEKASEIGAAQRRTNLRSNRALSSNKLKCIICQQDKKDPRDRRKNETLTKCTNLNDTLLNAAKLRQDDRTLLELESRGVDNVAGDLLYHCSCYREYTRAKDLRRLEDTPEDDSDPYRLAFQELVAEIEETIFNDSEDGGAQVQRMPELRDRFLTLLEHQGVTCSKGYRTEKLKRRLRAHFKDCLTFYQPAPGTACIVYASSAPAYRIAEAMANSREGGPEGPSDSQEELDLEDLPAIDATFSAEASNVSEVYHSALLLRKVIQDAAAEHQQPFPPSASHLNEKTALAAVPDLLFNFLAWLLFGNKCPSASGEHAKAKVSLEPDMNRYVVSIGQDIVYRVTHGRVKPPKHVSLSMAVRHITGSSQMVCLLSRFGHGLSLTQVQEIDTAMAEKQLATQDEEDVFVPPTAAPGIWTTFSWDNNDICEETLSGKGTTHCTNGILVQRKTQSALPEPQPGPAKRSRRRALTAFQATEVLPYNAGQRWIEPTAVNISESSLTDALDVHQRSEKQDFAWMFTRRAPQRGEFFRACQEVQVIPAWSGFNAAVQEKSSTPAQSTVSYCPVIGASPTCLDSVQ